MVILRQAFKMGSESNALLGRDASHWSFFLDSGFLSGRKSDQALSSNSFETGTPYQRYSDLDFYLMGLKPPKEVRDTFYMDGARIFHRFSFERRFGTGSERQIPWNSIPITVD